MQANDLVSQRCTSSCQKKRDHSLKSVRCFFRCVWSKIALSHYFGHWLILQFVLPYKPWFLKRLLVPAQFHSPVQFLCSSAKRAGQFFCSFVANLLQYLCAKNYRNITWFDFSFFLSPLGWHTRSLRMPAKGELHEELHEDLVVVAEFQMFTVRHPEAILHMNECRDTIVRSSSLVDCKMTFVWLPATSLQAWFSTTSLFTVSHNSLI